MSNLKELLSQYATEEAGSRFQREFSYFVADNMHEVVVETGAGISTLFLLDAMVKGNLYSIDTKPWCGFIVEHPDYELVQEDSLKALLPLFKKTGPFDFFLHDGCHDIKWQTYEYEFAYGCLKPGGYIASDDYTWGQHNAWDTFNANHDLRAFKIGDIEVCMKHVWLPEVVTKDNAEAFHKECLALAELAEEKWLEFGNKNSDVVWDIRV